MRREIVCLGGMGMLWILGSAWALDGALNREQQARLQPEAKAAYEKAMEAADHVRIGEAIENLRAAAKAEPGNAPLRMLAARVAVEEGKKKMGEEALDLYRLAEAMYLEILNLPEDAAKQSEVKRARKDLEQVQSLMVDQAERDARRMEIGRQIVVERSKELEAAHIQAQQAARNRKAGTAVRAGQPGMAGVAVQAAPAAAMGGMGSMMMGGQGR